MVARTHTLASLAVIAVIAVAAGCGSEDGGDTIGDAKAALSKDCQQGKASDKPLCDCIADKLADAGNDAEELLAIDKEVNGGASPGSVLKAAKACAEFAAP